MKERGHFENLRIYRRIKRKMNPKVIQLHHLTDTCWELIMNSLSYVIFSNLIIFSPFQAQRTDTEMAILTF